MAEASVEPESSVTLVVLETTEEQKKPGKADGVEEPYKCRFCGLSYNYLTTLRAHERVHNVDAPYVCTKCGDAFRFYAELQYHMMGHEGQKVYKCKCGRGFYRYTDLLYHHHPEDGESNSDEETIPKPNIDENKAFRTKHPLKIYSDTRNRPYICQYCSKSYADSRELMYHMYSHRGERSFNVRSSRYHMARDLV